jgi:hypothetical protein
VGISQLACPEETPLSGVIASLRCAAIFEFVELLLQAESIV